MNTTFNLQRFLAAQQYDYPRALQEIRNGFKQSHWVWYIFPQLKGFGHSYNSEYYGISGLEEAKAYYEHPVLGSRLVEITEALLGHKDKSAQEILSPIDALKVKSCMTLFWVASANPLFKTVIDVFYDGKMDNKTVSKTVGTLPIKNEVDMHHHRSPFTVEHLDFMIVDRVIRGYNLNEESPGVTALYNFFGRWFSKRFICDRIRYIDEVSEKEGHHIPSFIEAEGSFRNAFQQLNEFFVHKTEAESHEDRDQIISVDTEMILEINNLCHFNETQKVYGLLKKYLLPEEVSGNWGIYLKTFLLQDLEGIPRNLLFFYWEDDGIPQLWCYMSATDNAYYQSFGFDYANTNGNDFGDHRSGEYGFVQKDLNLNKILNYSGPDYILMFRKSGDVITSCTPPLIRHKYRLMPLFVPGDTFALEKNPEFFDKYYDLYYSGNWNARRALERGGFNLNV